MDIAVCDDDRVFLDEMKQVLSDCRNIGFIECFSDIELFRKSVMDGIKYDAVLMDIDWKEAKNGIDYGEWLYSKSPRTSLIFVTGYSEQYIEAVFMQNTKIAGYLKKPVNKNNLQRLLERITDDKKKISDETMVVKQRGKVISLLYKDICCIESTGHNVIIHTLNEEISVYDSLQNVVKNLPDNFFQCHKSYVVNFDYVKVIDENEVVLSRGNIVKKAQVSGRRKKKMEEAFFDYLVEEDR